MAIFSMLLNCNKMSDTTDVSRILGIKFNDHEWIEHIKNKIETETKNLQSGWCKYDGNIVIGEFGNGIPQENTITITLNEQNMYIFKSMYVNGKMSQYAYVSIINNNKEIKTIKEYFQ